MFGKTAYFLVSFIGNRYNPAFTAAHFLNITENLGVCAVSSSNKNNRHILVNQGNRAVFHFGCRVTLCVDIRDLFELQCALKSNREVEAATKIKRVFRVFETIGYILDLTVELKNTCCFFRKT